MTETISGAAAAISTVICVWFLARFLYRSVCFAFGMNDYTIGFTTDDVKLRFIRCYEDDTPTTRNGTNGG